MKETGIINNPLLLAKYAAEPKFFPQPEAVLQCISAETISSVRSSFEELLQLWDDRMASNIRRIEAKLSELHQHIEGIDKQVEELNEKVTIAGVAGKAAKGAVGPGIVGSVIGVTATVAAVAVASAVSSDSASETNDLLAREKKDLTLKTTYAKDIIVMLSDIQQRLRSCCFEARHDMKLMHMMMAIRSNTASETECLADVLACLREPCRDDRRMLQDLIAKWQELFNQSKPSLIVMNAGQLYYVMKTSHRTEIDVFAHVYELIAAEDPVSLNKLLATRPEGMTPEAIKTEENHKGKVYDQAYSQAQSLEKNGGYTTAADIYAQLIDWKDAAARAKDCLQKAMEARYQKAADLLQSGRPEDAIRAFEELSGYKDSREQIARCRDAINERTYQEAEKAALDGDKSKAAKLFESLGAYRDSADRAKQLLSERADKRTESLITEARELMEHKKWKKALTLLKRLKNDDAYRDMIDACNAGIKRQKITIAAIAGAVVVAVVLLLVLK